MGKAKKRKTNLERTSSVTVTHMDIFLDILARVMSFEAHLILDSTSMSLTCTTPQ